MHLLFKNYDVELKTIHFYNRNYLNCHKNYRIKQIKCHRHSKIVRNCMKLMKTNITFRLLNKNKEMLHFNIKEATILSHKIIKLTIQILLKMIYDNHAKIIIN